MKITMLWAQRICGYDGQYEPEMIEAVDEITDEDNPEYINNKYREVCSKIGEKFDSAALIETEFNDNAIIKALGIQKIKSCRTIACNRPNQRDCQLAFK